MYTIWVHGPLGREFKSRSGRDTPSPRKASTDRAALLQDVRTAVALLSLRENRKDP